MYEKIINQFKTKNVWAFVVFVFITVLIIRGGICAWQNTKNNKNTIAVDNMAGWKTYINKNDGYSIMYPPEFWPQYDGEILNYDINDPKYRHGNPDGIKIQINKPVFLPNTDVSPANEDIAYQKNTYNDFDEEPVDIELGNFINGSQYTNDGPGGASITYSACDKKTKNCYTLTVFEDGYSKNKELVEKIIATFKILQ